MDHTLIEYYDLGNLTTSDIPTKSKAHAPIEVPIEVPLFEDLLKLFG